MTICRGKDGKLISNGNVMLEMIAIDNLVEHGMFNGNYGIYKGTFDNAVMAAYDTAKVWGYLDSNEKQAWKNLLRMVCTQNPSVHVVEAHWYCSDEYTPYYFRYTRSKDRLDIYYGSAHDAAWTDYDINHDDSPYTFNMERYLTLAIQDRLPMKL